MIQVNRGTGPDGFAARSAQWQEQFAKARQQNPKLSAARFWDQVRSEIRPYAQILDQIFYNKCAFCESKMAHVSRPQIEHYYPKSKFPERMFNWQNWLLSCAQCNEIKGTYFPFCDDRPCLLDPASEDPGDHIDFLRAQILYKTWRGQETISLLELNRISLQEERTRWLIWIDSLLLLCCMPSACPQARQLLIWAMQPDAPFTAMTRAYLSQKVPRLAYPESPHPFVELYDPIKDIIELVEHYQEQLTQMI
ncbi:MAG: hypothetical protein JW934_14800 [Anaerolineae bacterium]|nr:hypothetical protein [Anaerolineae bacterium]